MSDNTCVICLDIINGSHVTTPCNHKMHNKCLTQWLLTEDTCPLCRHDIGIKSSNYDGEQNDPEFIQWEVDILTEIFTQHDEKIDGAINELIDYKYDGVFNSRNLWSTTGDDYFVRINTKNQIIDMNINFQDISKDSKLLSVVIKCIDKKIQKLERIHREKQLLISKYTNDILTLPLEVC